VHQGRQCERNPEYVDNLLISLSDDINEFINRTNRNRSALMRKIKQNGLKEDQFAGFYALVLISMHQAREFIEIRDMYRDFVVPGKGNRVTAASLSSLLSRTRSMFNDNEFPEVAFDDFCLDIDSDDS